MNNSTHNGYPVSQEAFKSETPLQFADGQLAAAFTQAGDSIAWGRHPLANVDPTAQAPLGEAIIRTDQGALYLKDGVVTDIEESERQGTRISSRLGENLPDTEIGSGWRYRFAQAPVVSGVLLRDGSTGAQKEPGRHQVAKPNPFDEAANRLAAVDRAEAIRKQRAAKVGPVVAAVAVGSNTLRPLSRPPERQRSYYRNGR